MPAHGVDVLHEVTPLVEQAHRYERQAKVSGRFDVVAGKDAKTTAVGGNAFIQSNLHAQVSDFHVHDPCGSLPFSQVLY